MGAKKVSASEFKAKCLAFLEDVSRTGTPLLVTKRGQPIARLVPVEGEEPASLLGSVSYDSEADLLAPVGEAWEAEG